MGLVLRDLGQEYCSWDALLQISAEHPIKSYMEVGTRYGDSLVRVLASNRLEHICIADVWHESYFGPNNNGTQFDRSHKHIERMLRGMGYDTSNMVTWLDGDSAKTVPLLNPKETRFDMILVDGDHDPEPARTDLFNVWPLVKQGGFLVFDDIMDVQHMMELWTFFTRQHKTEIAENIIRTDKKFGVAVAVKQYNGLETSKIRSFVFAKFPEFHDKNLRGIDVGCSRDPLTGYCVAFDRPEFSHYPEVTESGDARHLPFPDAEFDFLWSSHCLEDFEDTEAVLKEWVRVIKPGGLIGLYVPHPELYKGSNSEHFYNGFVPEELSTKLRGLHCSVEHEFIHDFPTGPFPCYSTLVVARKL